MQDTCIQQATYWWLFHKAPKCKQQNHPTCHVTLLQSKLWNVACFTVTPALKCVAPKNFCCELGKFVPKIDQGPTFCNKALNLQQIFLLCGKFGKGALNILTLFRCIKRLKSAIKMLFILIPVFPTQWVSEKSLERLSVENEPFLAEMSRSSASSKYRN